MNASEASTTTKATGSQDAAPAVVPAATTVVVSHREDAAGGSGAKESFPPLELGWTRLGKRPAPGSREPSSLPSKSSDRRGAPPTIPPEGSNNADDLPPDHAGSVVRVSQGVETNECDVENDNNDDDDDDFWSWQGSSSCWSCTDPNCVARRREMMTSSGGPAVGGGGSSSAKTAQEEEGMSFLRQTRKLGGNGQGQLVSERFRVVRGNAVWLLPTSSTSDLDWFQGYLLLPPNATIPTTPAVESTRTGRKPWGLLAQQVDIDECLACADGGYRRVSITVYDWSARDDDDRTTRSSHNLGEADWTGGDMMKLLGSNVRMRPAKLLTGRAAVPYVTGLFGSLWRRIASDHRRDSFDADGANDDVPLRDVLDLLPDVAIVLGDMELIVPVEASG